jgi:hypothetical protein
MWQHGVEVFTLTKEYAGSENKNRSKEWFASIHFSMFFITIKAFIIIIIIVFYDDTNTLNPSFLR